MRRNVFVAAGKQHKAVEGMQLRAGLNVHCHNISGGRIIPVAVFAKADRAAAVAAKFDWHTAGLQNTRADLLGQLLQMHMSGSGLAPRVLDADTRTVNVLVVISDGL